MISFREMFFVCAGLTTCFFAGVFAQDSSGTDNVPRIHVQVTNLKAGRVGVKAHMVVPCSLEEIWSVLTDYNHLHEFIPKMLHSELVKTDGHRKIINQVGRTGIAIFQITARTQLQVDEIYLQRIDFESLKGDFKVFRGSWSMAADGDSSGTRVDYQAEIKPRFPTPQALVRHVQENDLPEVMQAIIDRAREVKSLRQ